MNWIPLIILICLSFMGLGLQLGKHGEPRNEKYNFFMGLGFFSSLLDVNYLDGVLLVAEYRKWKEEKNE